MRSETPEERAVDAAERRFRMIMLGGAAVGVVFLLAVCATFAAVAPYVARFKAEPTRIEVQVTGTVERIAGMPLPADAVLLSQTYRENGGTFDFTTHHRPDQIYNFYYYLVAQQGRWIAGSRPIIGQNEAEFRFFPGVVPRLTIVTVKCAGEVCRVHVDY